jgi:hypothetical protein
MNQMIDRIMKPTNHMPKIRVAASTFDCRPHAAMRTVKIRMSHVIFRQRNGFMTPSYDKLSRATLS